MAPLTNCEIIVAECALTIVTSHATLRATSGVMIERLGRRDLSALRHAGLHLVAFGAGDLFMFGVIKADPECRCRFRGSRITTQLMTGATRRNIAAAGLSARSVTTITSCVRIESVGY